MQFFSSVISHRFHHLRLKIINDSSIDFHNLINLTSSDLANVFFQVILTASKLLTLNKSKTRAREMGWNIILEACVVIFTP